VVVLFAIVVVGSTGLYLRSRRTAVHPGNVNAEWSGAVVSDEDEDEDKDHPDVMAA
jgi:hypothetical protein